MKAFFYRVLHFYRKSKLDDIHGISCELAYTISLAAFPLIVLFVSLLLILQKPKTVALVISLFSYVLPPHIYDSIDKSVQGLLKIATKETFLLSIAFSFFTASTVFSCIIKSARKLEGKLPLALLPFWKINFRFLFFSAFCIFVIGNFLYLAILFERFLHDQFGLLAFRSNPKFVAAGLGFLFVLFLTIVSYSLSTEKIRPLPKVISGAFLYSLYWAVVTLGYGFYLQFQTVGLDYSVAYFLMEKITTFLVYVYMLSLGFLIGLEWSFSKHQLAKS